MEITPDLIREFGPGVRIVAIGAAALVAHVLVKTVRRLAIIENVFRQRVVAALRQLDPSYADWMISTIYRVQPEPRR